MSTASETGRSLRLAAGVVTVVALLLAATAVYILAVPVDRNDFESTTGVAWDTFSSANPNVAEYLVREARILAVGYLGLTLMVAAIAWSRLRRGDPWSARTLWLFPATLWGAALVFLAGDGVALGAMYVAVGAIVAAALVAAHRNTR